MTKPADDFGARLHDARDRAGVSLAQIAERTKLSLRNLKALESNRIDQLPGGIYRRAIVRHYATEVGLDPERTLQQFLSLHPDDIPKWSDLVPAADSGGRSRTARALIGIASALIPAFALAVYVASPASDTPPARSVAGAEALPAPFTSSREADTVALLLSVSSPTLLQVVADGREIAARRFSAGEILRVTLGSDIVLVGDNAGAVQFSIDGRAARRFGTPGTPLTARIARSDFQHWLVSP